MFKLLSIVLAMTSVGALAATPAHACGCCDSASTCCAAAAAPSCCTTTASADNTQGSASVSQAPGAPNAARNYSYEPSMRSYSAPARSQTPLYLVPKSQR